MVKRQKNETTYDGGTCAVNAADAEIGHAGTAEKVEQPATDDRSDDAKQNVYDGALACGADDLARDQAQPQAQQDPHEHGHPTLQTLHGKEFSRKRRAVNIDRYAATDGVRHRG